MPSYSEFKKLAREDESALIGVSGLNPDSISDFQHREGTKALTPEEIAHQKMLNDAANEGFKEGLAGALAGDGYRGLARGGLREIADTADYLTEAPIRAGFIPAMLLAKGIKWTTGNDKMEKAVRKARQKTVDTLAYGTHKATGAMRTLADNEALDPKYLTQEAYAGSVNAGRGGIIAADLVIGAKLDKVLRGMKYLGRLYRGYNTSLLADVGATVGGAVATNMEDEAAYKRRMAMHDAMVGYFKKRTETPPGPFIAHVPKLENNFINQLAIMEAANDPEGAAILDRIETDDEYLNYQAVRKRIEQLDKQLAGAGVGGAIGLTAAHQITKRIPYLKKRKMLRYLINMIGAGGAGYAGWKLMGK